MIRSVLCLLALALLALPAKAGPRTTTTTTRTTTTRTTGGGFRFTRTFGFHRGFSTGFYSGGYGYAPTVVAAPTVVSTPAPVSTTTVLTGPLTPAPAAYADPGLAAQIAALNARLAALGSVGYSAAPVQYATTTTYQPALLLAAPTYSFSYGGYSPFFFSRGFSHGFRRR